MRKALIAVIVASALFAVGAFAANFAVQSEDVASGANDVTACADLVDIDFTTVFSPADDDWRITEAVVTFYDGTTTSFVETDDCEFFDATLVLENDSNVELTPSAAVEEVPENTSSVTFDWASDGPLVGVVHQAAVLVDGQTLFVDPT